MPFPATPCRISSPASSAAHLLPCTPVRTPPHRRGHLPLHRTRVLLLIGRVKYKILLNEPVKILTVTATSLRCLQAGSPNQYQASFSIDTSNTVVLAACTDVLKSVQRRQRYKLKKQYFDAVPANEVPRKSPVETIPDVWKVLLDTWFSEKHKNKCAANKLNREKVKYHHRTSSRCATGGLFLAYSVTWLASWS